MRYRDHITQKSILPPLASMNRHSFTEANQHKQMETRRASVSKHMILLYLLKLKFLSRGEEADLHP